MTLPSNQEIQEVFFDAMAAGWALEKPDKVAIDEFPGMRSILFNKGDFRVLDNYFTTPHSNRSEGWTIIWYQLQPVWTMHYGGWYTEEAIPFLKSCLRQAYVEERRFYGGRGPERIHNGYHSYTNHVEEAHFSKFSGREEVRVHIHHFLGYHWYRGGSLLS